MLVYIVEWLIQTLALQLEITLRWCYHCIKNTYVVSKTAKIVEWKIFELYLVLNNAEC